MNSQGVPQELKADGHPLLIQAALDGVGKSVFEGSSENRHSIVIRFDVREPPRGTSVPAFEVVTPDYWIIVTHAPVINVMYARAAHSSGHGAIKLKIPRQNP